MYSFQRYLSAKKSVDDRALNRAVWGALARQIHSAGSPLRILEAGAGSGAMLERMLSWRLLAAAEYTAIDAQPENTAEALERLPAWCAAFGYRVERRPPDGLRLVRGRQQVAARFLALDLFDFIPGQRGQAAWDLLVAHSFLDLLDIPASLPGMFSLLRPGGLFYFTLNFDGLTLLEPVIDPPFDELLLALYHRSMDERITNGKRSGDSRAGRHLFHDLRQAGAEILEVGASDWAVFPRQGAYPADEAYFLHHIIHFFEETLGGHPELDAQRFAAWCAARHAQVERAELVYIAHQLDFLGRLSARQAQ